MLERRRHFLLDPRVDPDMVPATHRRHRNRGRLLFRRFGRGRNERVSLQWVLPRHQRIRKRYPFAKITQRAHVSTFPERLPMRLLEALKTAR